jgi:integrase
MASISRFRHKWRAHIKIAGQPRRSKVFDSKPDAIRWARQQEALEAGDFQSSKVPYTLKHLLKAYRENTPAGGSTKQACLKMLERHLGHYRLVELTPKVFIEFARGRARGELKGDPRRGRTARRPTAGASPATVLQDLLYLSTALKHGGVILHSMDARLAREHLVSAMRTLRHMKLVRESTRRERRPTEEELQKIDDALAARPRSAIPVFDIVLFAICTCMRLGEIVGPDGIVWEDVSIKRRTVLVRNRKHPDLMDGNDTELPLITGPVTYRGATINPVDILTRQHTARRRSGRVFPYSINTIAQAFSKVCADQGIDGLHFHDLRHDGISRLFEAKYGIPEVALVSGHKSWKNLQRYTQINPDTLHRDT